MSGLSRMSRSADTASSAARAGHAMTPAADFDSIRYRQNKKTDEAAPRSRGRRAWRLRIRATTPATFSSMRWPPTRFWISAAIATSPTRSRLAATSVPTLGLLLPRRAVAKRAAAMGQCGEYHDAGGFHVGRGPAGGMGRYRSNDGCPRTGPRRSALPQAITHLPQSGLGGPNGDVQQGVQYFVLSGSRSDDRRLRLLGFPA